MARGSCITLYVLTADRLYHVTRGTWATAWVNLKSFVEWWIEVVRERDYAT